MEYYTGAIPELTSEKEIEERVDKIKESFSQDAEAVVSKYEKY